MKKKNQKEINVQRNARFFDRWAHSYDAPLFQFWMKGFHQPVLQNIDFSKKVKILDVSCGTGELLLAMYTKDKNKNLRLYGLELSEGMLRRARHKLSKDIVLKTGDVHRLPFPSNYFDLVISTEAFHHYYGQKRALGELARVTKKGGTVIIVDVNFFLPFIHRLFERYEPGCVKINSRTEMRRLSHSSGLKSIRQQRNFLFAVMTAGTKI